MESLESLNSPHGLKGLVFTFIGLIAAHLAKDIVKGIFVFINRNKKPSREEFQQLTKALNENRSTMDLQKTMLTKMSEDLRRVYLYLKVIAGDDWPSYRKRVEELEKEFN